MLTHAEFPKGDSCQEGSPSLILTLMQCPEFTLVGILFYLVVHAVVTWMGSYLEQSDVMKLSCAVKCEKRTLLREYCINKSVNKFLM